MQADIKLGLRKTIDENNCVKYEMWGMGTARKIYTPLKVMLVFPPYADVGKGKRVLKIDDDASPVFIETNIVKNIASKSRGRILGIVGESPTNHTYLMTLARVDDDA